MDAEQAWQAVLGQLQMKMPRASFDAWVRDSHLLSYEDGVMDVGVRNLYARDWLENRLPSTVSRFLAGMLYRVVDVRFVADDSIGDDSEDNSGDDAYEDD